MNTHPSVAHPSPRQDSLVRVAVGRCSLGLALVAWTDRGVRAVLLGDDRAELTHDLQARLPGASLVAVEASADDPLSRVIALIESPRVAQPIAIDAGGTAFQRSVWEALREIPAGSTASYTDLARRLGRPSAVRAVAGACAANPLAVVVPCHRAVRSDGTLAGYRWGVERKRALLSREGS
ncbi:MAG: methylated-DNA--[protein]-cysteine S-methyltransferase [Deltaproteobacteria bacterium]|jgi:AraC family transcriptional regulator of adaptative response/methylated-DNA-[protein]-cysteine methyltransferase|nr:methylated-DNA--[protein]-cysteine S-methyltransferase [Deltaproteobacteria bacterium]